MLIKVKIKIKVLTREMLLSDMILSKKVEKRKKKTNIPPAMRKIF
jgi:hypothetical protein